MKYEKSKKNTKVLKNGKQIKNLALKNSAKCQRSTGKILCQNNLIYFLTVTKRKKIIF